MDFFTKIRVSERKTKRDVITGNREDQVDSGVVLIPLTVKRRAGTPGLAQALHQDGPGWIYNHQQQREVQVHLVSQPENDYGEAGSPARNLLREERAL